MSAAVGTKELNFNSKRERAISASSSRIEQPCSNGSDFTCGQVVDIRLPSGMARGNYLNFVDSYIKMNIAATATAHATKQIYLPRNGVYNLIQKVEILTSSSTISVIDDYRKLCNIFLDSECSPEFKEGLGGVQYGMTSGVDPPNSFVGTAELDDDAVTITQNPDKTVSSAVVADTAVNVNISSQPVKTSKGLKLTGDANGTKKSLSVLDLF